MPSVTICERDTARWNLSKKRSLSRKQARKDARDIIQKLIENYLDVGAAYEDYGDDEASALTLNAAMEKWRNFFD